MHVINLRGSKHSTWEIYGSKLPRGSELRIIYILRTRNFTVRHRWPPPRCHPMRKKKKKKKKKLKRRYNSQNNWWISHPNRNWPIFYKCLFVYQKINPIHATFQVFCKKWSWKRAITPKISRGLYPLIKLDLCIKIWIQYTFFPTIMNGNHLCMDVRTDSGDTICPLPPTPIENDGA